MILSTIGRCTVILQLVVFATGSSAQQQQQQLVVDAGSVSAVEEDSPFAGVDCSSFTTENACTAAGLSNCSWHRKMGCVDELVAPTTITTDRQRWQEENLLLISPINMTSKQIRKLQTTPTRRPTKNPISRRPTPKPSTRSPTSKPTTRSPTAKPTTRTPSRAPTRKPTSTPSAKPTSAKPTSVPTVSPTSAPSKKPVLSSSPTNSPSRSPTTTITAQIGVQIVPNPNVSLTVILPQSQANMLITMSQVSADNNDAVPVARSYDAYPYETLHPLLLPVNCNSGTCSVTLPPHSGSTAMHYILDQFTPPALPANRTAAKLLLQGTYGPTQTSLLEAMGHPNAASWVQAQMDMEPTLLRAHYRQRANAYTKNDLHHHGTRLACEQGSRWNRYAFNRWRDIGKTIVEEASGTGTWLLKIDGIPRTEVTTRPSVQFSLPSSSYVICRNDLMHTK